MWIVEEEKISSKKQKSKYQRNSFDFTFFKLKHFSLEKQIYRYIRWFVCSTKRIHFTCAINMSNSTTFGGNISAYRFVIHNNEQKQVNSFNQIQLWFNCFVCCFVQHKLLLVLMVWLFRNYVTEIQSKCDQFGWFGQTNHRFWANERIH